MNKMVNIDVIGQELLKNLLEKNRIREVRSANPERTDIYLPFLQFLEEQAERLTKVVVDSIEDVDTPMVY